MPTMDGAVESPVVGAAFNEKQQPKILAALSSAFAGLRGCPRQWRCQTGGKLEMQ